MEPAVEGGHIPKHQPGGGHLHGQLSSGLSKVSLDIGGTPDFFGGEVYLLSL